MIFKLKKYDFKVKKVVCKNTTNTHARSNADKWSDGFRQING